MLSTQYWQSNEITSSPVTGMDGVSGVFVAVACDASTVAVVVSAVPVVSVARGVGEPVKMSCRAPGTIGVPPSVGAQAAASRMTVTAPNRNTREILFIYFLLS